MNDFEVFLDAQAISEARSLAEVTLSRYKSVQGQYRNTSNSHLVGRFGEIACASWISKFTTVDSVFREESRDRECDLLAGGKRIEVKTWNADYWVRWGRCVAVNQLPGIAAKADLIIWCAAVLSAEPPVKVRIMGWSAISDLRALEPVWTGPVGKQVHNYQVPEAWLRSMATLPGIGGDLDGLARSDL